VELFELAKHRVWLVKMTNAVNQHWRKSNASKRILIDHVGQSR
jgi:hypothetical protein